jgi:hypothetical protein
VGRRIEAIARLLQRYSLAFGRKGAFLLVLSVLMLLGAATSKAAMQQRSMNVATVSTTAPVASNLPVTQNPQPTLRTTESATRTATPATVAPTPTLPTPAPTRTYRSSYQAPICTYRSIPYKTVYQNASWIDAGKTQEFSGMNGQEKICNPANGGAPTITTVYAPYDKKIYVGTYVKPTYSTVTPTYNPAPKNYSICNQFSGSSAFEQCVYAVSQQ